MKFSERLHQRVKRYKGKLTCEQLSLLYESIVDYGNGGTPSTDDATVSLIFGSFIDDLDAERRKSEKRAAAARINGAKGGRPPKHTKVAKARGELGEGTKIDYNAFAEFFNQEIQKSGSAIPQVTKLSARRSAALKARAKDYGKSELADVVRRAAKSDFLNGRTGTPFVASFDWIFRPNNFIKIIEGNYDNKINTSRRQVGAAPNTAEEHEADNEW